MTRIKPAALADVPIIAEYRYRMFAEMFPEEQYELKRERFVKDTDAYYREHLGDANQFSLCVWARGEIIGCGTILFLERPPGIRRPNNSLGYILNIFVRPEFRRQGIASKIMLALHKAALKRGVCRIGLHASVSGRFVYDKLGYKQKENYLEIDI